MFRKAVFVAALLCSAGVAQASDKPVYAAVPEWVKPAPAIDAATLGDDAPVLLILDRQQRIADGQVWSYQDTETRAASPEILSQIGTVSLRWSPDKGDLIIHRAEIVRGGEHIDLLKAGDPFTVLRREQQLEQFQLDGMLTATMPVSGLRVGDALRLTYSTTEKDPTLGGNVQLAAPIVADPFRVRFARERMVWPRGTDLHYQVLGDKITPTLSAVGGYNELVITEPVAKQPETPEDAPPRYKRGTMIEATTFPDWASVSKVMAPLYDTSGSIAAGSPLAAEVARIEQATIDPAQRAMLALQLVQDKVRYLFNGMDNGNYVPQKPADTWQSRYGDCKAKTMLLLALLHAMKIDAEPVLASSQLGDAVPVRLPMPGAFDHVLVRAMIGDKSVWLDGTDIGAQPVDIADIPAFTNVLPLRANGAAIMPLPVPATARPDAVIDIVFDQSAGLSLPTLYTLTMKTRGQMAQMVHAAKSQASDDQIESMVRATIQPYVGQAVIADHAIAYDAADATATITASGLLATKWNRQDQRYRTTLDYFIDNLNFNPDRSRPAWKDIPVSVNQSFNLLLRTTMILPDGGKGFSVEGDKTLSADLAGGRIERRFSFGEGKVSVEDHVRSSEREIAVADLPHVRAAVTAAKSRMLRVLAPSEYPTHWQVAQRLARDDGAKAILGVYAKALAKQTDDADKAWAYGNRAYFEAGIYDYHAAVADLDRAIALQPGADLYRRRAALYNTLGDQPKALADYQAAQALDPGSDETIGAFATLEADVGNTDAALALVQPRIDAGGKEKPVFLSLKADILSRAHDKDAALASIDEAITASPGNANLLNSRCWIKGTLGVALDTALKDCTRSIELADSSAAALDSRALVYFRMDRLDEALADLNAALDAAPGQAASMFMRGVIHKRQGNAASAAADLAAARLIEPKIDKDYARFGIKP
ncbi:DUF3857 domain-containing protein [Hephaestia sp. GCM10023244]|uniref:DUF3857 domain-containing protein n=1 Tax=unclassified Hephaestia TaxID=2631281 RepID=UPI002077463D|nr:DUF3857 domain-containing protein [Hephaestia sp. MAHUQ-44]MCM8729588.1 DUF3857 domain-containing protein [Hephaestia sp. MAHUQ-44]